MEKLTFDEWMTIYNPIIEDEELKDTTSFV